MVLRVAIVDDEPLARERLQRLLEQVQDCECLGSAGDAEAARSLIQRLQPQVLLLDIRMPGRDGMELAAELRRVNMPPAIIFTTAHADHAVAAFENEAVDYLLKPVRLERLLEALDRARRWLQHGRVPALRTTLAGEVQRVPLDRIVCCQAEDKYTVVVAEDSESLSEISLKRLERRFGDWLMRVHRNALVAPRRVRGLRSDDAGRLYVRLDGSSREPLVARRHRAAVRRLLADESPAN